MPNELVLSVLSLAYVHISQQLASLGICFRKQARDSVVDTPYTRHLLKSSTDWY